MDHHEIEGHALELYRLAGIDPERPVGAMRLARSLPALDVLFAVDGPRASYLPPMHGANATLTIRNGIAGVARQWLAAHELGHHCLRDSKLEHEEQIADNIAAAIVAPMPAMRNLAGLDLAPVARALGTTQSIVALRLGEVCSIPVALVLRGRVKRRGHDTMPTDRELRKIVRAGGCSEASVVPLTDAPGRFAVIARGEC